MPEDPEAKEVARHFVNPGRDLGALHGKCGPDSLAALATYRNLTTEKILQELWEIGESWGPEGPEIDGADPEAVISLVRRRGPTIDECAAAWQPKAPSVSRTEEPRRHRHKLKRSGRGASREANGSVAFLCACGADDPAPVRKGPTRKNPEDPGRTIGAARAPITPSW